MKLRLVNTTSGFVCETDDDARKKRRLKLGSVYEVTIKESRNPRFHRKYMAMLSLAWEYLPELYQVKFGDRENFRYLSEIRAGFCDLIFDPVSNMATFKAKSIAFDKMSEDEFEKLYNAVLNVILRDYVPKDISGELIDKLKWF